MKGINFWIGDLLKRKKIKKLKNERRDVFTIAL